MMAAMLACLLLLPGCGGCGRNADALSKSEDEKRAFELEKKKEEKPKPDFQFRQLNTLPNPVDRVERAIKPGHWASGVLEAVANNYDYRGQLAIEPLDLDQMPFRLGTARGVVLPKTQRRDLDLLFFPPVGVNPRSMGAELQSPRGALVYRERFPLTRMPDHQYYLIVLARTPERYMFLRDMDFVRVPRATLNMPGVDAHFRTLMPLINRGAPLPASLLAWTSTACVVWDDLDPQTLHADQQRAMIDWLHWGGQLVISGPSSLGALKGSFLDRYLPAESTGTVELGSDQLVELRREWSDPGRPLRVTRAWTAERLAVRPEARTLIWASDLPLVVDRQVGRGRIALTAFSLAQRSLLEWPGYDGFLHGCLLLRPVREFQFKEGDVVVAWHDRTPIDAAARVSNLRFFTRDSGSDDLFARREPIAVEPPTPSQEDLANAEFTGFDSDVNYGSGVAGWRDFSLAGDRALGALRDAAGIKIPSPTFVVGALSAYLLVLVPLNWGVFRAMNRVEWAWVAAPIISLAGALIVIRAAQLDIGFARASNELAVVEMQPRYDRAHVTRYVALYSSLATGYDIGFDDFGAVAMPFPDGTGLLRGQDRSTVLLRRDGKPVLENFRVASNSIGLIHAEHMLDLEGTLELEEKDGQLVVRNGTGWTLLDATIGHAGTIVELGKLGSGAWCAIDLARGRPFVEYAQEATTAVEPGQVDPRTMMVTALGGTEGDEWRLTGWIDEPLAGMTVTPVAAQARQRTVVVAHLRYGALPSPLHDAVMRSQVERKHRIEPRRYTEPEQGEEAGAEP
jgi:hypothetical protein